MDRAQITGELQNIFCRVLEDPGIVLNDAMTAHDHPAWDSLSHIKLIVSVEQHFKKRFSNAEVARLANVGDLVSLLEKKLKS